ncbi:hypothetical protein [Deinococcus yavapaiensis]|uniref:Uncharacterized protein n=1 Tax=Deinococcus yavapaiensis KR-236 TaxID=694435 RepID=A0A318S2Z8_9DEIO|nr:hypothetical protein [Deinococcus yavapaiensis]PYE50038.1 hypothetical protein DES52_11959 [Deinococcus yavapaiensis KR-236]
MSRLDDTLGALQENSVALDLDTTLDFLEAWQRDLRDADIEGGEDLANALARLQAQLESDEPDGSAISEILADLANLTQDAADTASDELAGKLQLLSDTLGEMSEEAGA